MSNRPYGIGKHKRGKTNYAVIFLVAIFIVSTILFLGFYFSWRNENENGKVQGNEQGNKQEIAKARENATQPQNLAKSSEITREIVAEPPDISKDVSVSEEIARMLDFSFENEYEAAQTSTPAENDPLWNLILLNPGNAITSEIPMEFAKFDEQYIDQRAAEAYSKMCMAAQKNGITLYLRSGYRSMKTQRDNYNNSVYDYIEDGETEESAIKLTEKYYTRAGHSEHHSGLALDIITPKYHHDFYGLDERFAKTDAYNWLKENCYDYGFILRYPREKEDITKISFEPWHYRYVGEEHARAIKESGLCLEEYLQKLVSFYEKNETGEANREAMAEYATTFPQMLMEK